MQDSQPEGEPAPTQPKRRVGRLNWDELTYEEKRRRLKRQKDLFLRKFRREDREEMRQLKAALSEEELRNVKRLKTYERTGAMRERSRRSDGSVDITIWPHQKEKKRE
jgi:hypothetical protein